jgi:phosphohistidine phosphatase SixA
MPYVCNKCGGGVEDDAKACPKCAAPKASWTIIAEKTRTFVVGKGFTLHRGRSLRPGERDAERLVATSARCVTKRAAAAWAEEGLCPPHRYLLFVKYKPTASARDVELTIDFGTKEAGEASVEPPGVPIVARGAARQKPAPAKVRRVFLSRHGDRKSGDDAIDPTDGQARADALAARLEAEGITEILVTPLRRTQQTAAPLAKKLGLTPVVIDYTATDDDADVPGYVKRVTDHLARSKQAATLVVGHSETTPHVVQALSGKTPKLDGFGQLFTVTLGTPPQLAEERYGAGATPPAKVEEAAVEAKPAAAPLAPGELEVPLLFVYGDPADPLPVFEGVAVVDLGEPGPGGEPSFAPTIDVRAIRKPWRKLPVEAAGARWSVREAREGDPVELRCDTEQPDGAKAALTILEHDADGAHDEVTTLEGEVADGVLRAPWAYQLQDDQDDVDVGPVQGVPEFIFRTAPDGEELESGLLRYQTWIEVELKTQEGAPVAGHTLWLVKPDGSREERRTDEQGLARWDPVPPGLHTITDALPDEDDVPTAGADYLVVGDGPDAGEEAAAADEDFELVLGQTEPRAAGGADAASTPDDVDFELVIGRQ